MEASSESFEQAFAELQETVAVLEQGGLTLDEAIRRFERGMVLATRCSQLLDQAELRVTRLLAGEEQTAATDGDPFAF